MSSPQRRRRTVNKLAISAAAMAVCVFPTACDYSLASPPSVGSPTSPSVGDGSEVTTAPVVVPVGNRTDGIRVSRGDRDRDSGRGRGTRSRAASVIPAGTEAGQGQNGQEDQGQQGQGQDGQGQNGQDQNGQDGQGQDQNGQDQNGQGQDGQGQDGQGQDGQGQDGQGQDGQGQDGQDQNGQDQNGQDGQGQDQNVQGQDGQDQNGQNGQDQNGQDQDGLGEVAPPVGDNNGLEVLGRDCTNSNLPPHTGFQESPACVSTAMGEIAPEDRLPSLLITAAPENVAVGQTFMLAVSTRNLVRDRFLGAAAGGYYLESSFLNGQGLQRGHFHTACRILGSTDEAPDSSQEPEFFLATQDNGGGAAPDTVTIEVPGIDKAGDLQCTSWAGDGSHRTPMMTKANQTPAIDSVRITVGGNNAPDGAAAPQNDVNDADAVQDANKQAEAQADEFQQQRPDQDGAPQPGADSTLPDAAVNGDAGQNAGDAGGQADNGGDQNAGGN